MKIARPCLLVSIALTLANEGFATPMHVSLETPLMFSMLSNTTSFHNELNLLQAKNHLTQSTLYLGGLGQGGVSFVHASQPTFFYSNEMTYQSRNYASLDRAALAFMGNVNPWAAVYLETGATDIGQSYASTLNLNQTYLLLGDGVFPLYAFVGNKNIDFGDFSTVNIFAQPVTRWDFAGTALTAGAGYRAHGFNVTFSGLNGGEQGAEDYYGAGLWRVHNYTNYYTPKKLINNFAINSSYSAKIAAMDWTVGVGYMRGLWLGDPNNFFNNTSIGAWDINAQVHVQHVTLLAEFVNSTPNTNSFGRFTPHIPGSASLQTWDVGASYASDDYLLPHESIISADCSGVVGNNAFAAVTQWVLGLQNHIYKPFWVGIEYVHEDQTSNLGAMRSGLFFRTHDRVQVLRLDVTANF